MPKFTSLKRRFSHKRYPFSDEILRFMEVEVSFYASLKLANWRRFQVIPRILTSHTPADHPLNSDQVIGVFYFDTRGTGTGNQPFFKQDFIVNPGGLNREFISYAAGFPISQYVRPIQDFFSNYGSNRQYYHQGSRWNHHYLDLANLPHDQILIDWGSSLKQQWQANGRCSIEDLF